MSSNTWKMFLYDLVMKFRRDFESKFTPEQRNFLATRPNKRIKDTLGLLLKEPSQIAVFDFLEPFPIAFLITHNPNFPDLEFYIYERVADPRELTKRISQENPFWLKDIVQLGFFKEIESFKGVETLTAYNYAEEHAIVFFMQLEARKNPEFIVDSLFRSIERDLYDYRMGAERERIGKSALDLKENATQISEPEIRARVLDATNKIDKALDQMKHLEKYEERLGLVENEIGGVRKLVGTKSFGEWRVLVSDVDRLKGEHVPREVFEAKISELSTRINSLSEIKTAYDKLLAQQNEFMKQQADVMKQQASFVTWIKYATILLPIAVISVPIIEIIRYFLGMH